MFPSHDREAHTNENIPIGLSTTVTVPANSTVLVNVTYDVPIYIATNNAEAAGYVGIRMIVDGAESQQGTRKIALNTLSPQNSGNNYPLFNIRGEHLQSFSNPTATAETHTFVLLGYVEQGSINTPSVTYRFNMWNISSNYNEGRGYIKREELKI